MEIETPIHTLNKRCPDQKAQEHSSSHQIGLEGPPSSLQTPHSYRTSSNPRPSLRIFAHLALHNPTARSEGAR